MDRTPKKFVKQQVGPYAWEVAPPGSRAIYPLLRVGAGTLINDDGKIEIDQRLHDLDSPYAIDPSEEISIPSPVGELLLPPIKDLIARWNNGIFFYEVA